MVTAENLPSHPELNEAPLSLRTTDNLFEDTQTLMLSLGRINNKFEQSFKRYWALIYPVAVIPGITETAAHFALGTPRLPDASDVAHLPIAKQHDLAYATTLELFNKDSRIIGPITTIWKNYLNIPRVLTDKSILLSENTETYAHLFDIARGSAGIDSLSDTQLKQLNDSLDVAAKQLDEEAGILKSRQIYNKQL